MRIELQDRVYRVRVRRGTVPGVLVMTAEQLSGPALAAADADGVIGELESRVRARLLELVRPGDEYYRDLGGEG